MSASKVLLKHIRDFQSLLKLPKIKPTVQRYLPRMKVMLVSPHPDDEILMGSLALRLQTANHCKVINVAATLGSDEKRRSIRRRELTKATKLLKWQNVVLADDWSEKKTELLALIQKHQPTLIIAPHEHDRHPTHIKTAQLVLDSLETYTGHVAWAEYWAPMTSPNVLVEVSPELHQLQVKALECHAGEVARNPYHLRLLGWQMDTVRRGSEWLANKGAASAQMLMGQLYKIEKWENGKKQRSKPAPFIHLTDDASDWLV